MDLRIEDSSFIIIISTSCTSVPNSLSLSIRSNSVRIQQRNVRTICRRFFLTFPWYRHTCFELVSIVSIFRYFFPFVVEIIQFFDNLRVHHDDLDVKIHGFFFFLKETIDHCFFDRYHLSFLLSSILLSWSFYFLLLSYDIYSWLFPLNMTCFSWLENYLFLFILYYFCKNCWMKIFYIIYFNVKRKITRRLI